MSCKRNDALKAVGVCPSTREEAGPRRILMGGELGGEGGGEGSGFDRGMARGGVVKEGGWPKDA